MQFWLSDLGYDLIQSCLIGIKKSSKSNQSYLIQIKEPSDSDQKLVIR